MSNTKLTAAQQKNLETIRAAGGTIYCCRFTYYAAHPETGAKPLRGLHSPTVHKLVKLGLLTGETLEALHRGRYVGKFTIVAESTSSSPAPAACAHSNTRDGGAMFAVPTVCCLDCGHTRAWSSTTWSDGSKA